MTREELIGLMRHKRSFLCVGLDPDLRRLPPQLPQNTEGLHRFLHDIVLATTPYAVAYKVNTAFFEALGPAGFSLLHEIIGTVPSDTFLIADAKRGDIGNSAEQYAAAFFAPSGRPSRVDAVTVSPYMGHDSVMPFLAYPGKWTALLALTSNEGAVDFQLKKLDNGRYLFEEVLLTAQKWGSPDNLMFVAGATRPELLQRVRSLVPRHVLLVPGVGVQGGSLPDVCRAALTADGPVLVNVSRQVLYASSGANYAEAAARMAASYVREMNGYLSVVNA
ncbi:MAG: orotidine-5'-phosphate decarboxylase [Chitinophagales bacterium]|nr:orotidine-5'-phosphate decarboxylase [Chitinophagales bacterium]MDW8393429.1 orotidine-5'-phosphate decarboxylase [Chitinophagales bacterium]